jgi:hypothetical protein
MRAAKKANVLVKYRGAKRTMVFGQLVRMLSDTEIREVRSYVDSEHRGRVAKGEKFAPTRICLGCLEPHPLTRAFFRLRVRKGHKPCWEKLCLKCKHAKLDRKKRVAP